MMILPDPESNILHHTANLYLFKTPAGLEIRLNGLAHSVVVGKPETVDKAWVAMERLERYPDNLRRFLNHPAK